ncbi:flavin-containing monooxygenase [Nocardia brasiliensis]|uniref:flavin-containing monooxygenase n=1 Tax=Nocardia brasiliensis TaxID=37326 RepID=UPI003D8C5492
MRYTAIIVGAGFGGICMGAALKRAGVGDFLILEKASEVGGVWRDNIYPGCNCDVPSHLYSLSFAPYRDRHVRYPGQEQILAYLHHVADAEGLVPHLRVDCAVSTATYLEDRQCWEVITGGGERLEAEVVVFAVGQLHRPRLPEIPGRADFAGPAFHTAQWDRGRDLRGLDVAVIGTGSSAAQVLPTLASIAATVRVFQRTPHWVLPKPSRDFGRLTRATLSLPGAHDLYRRALYYGADMVLAPVMWRGWSARPVQWFAQRYLDRAVRDRDLRAAVTPTYPIGGKRIVFASDYYSTLSRPNVELIAAPITRMTKDTIVTGDSGEHRADAVVFATGFTASDFLAPIRVYGAGGAELAKRWSDGATALLGVAVPGFPNMFMVAGPNSFNSAGSNPELKELQVQYILDCLRWRKQVGAAAIEVTERAMARYERWLDRTIASTVWPSTPSWFRHRRGRVTNPWPRSARMYRRMLGNHQPETTFHAIGEPVASTNSTLFESCPTAMAPSESSGIA